MIDSKIKVLTLCSFAALFAAGQAVAHTGVRDKATEGAASYNGFTITHGCGDHSGQTYPVLGQVALFPYGADVVFRDELGNPILDANTSLPSPNGNGTISTSSLALSCNRYYGLFITFCHNPGNRRSSGRCTGTFLEKWRAGT